MAAPLRPLARQHLPFASAAETLPRVAGWYLLQQYRAAQRGEPADWNLEALSDLYDALQQVNEGLSDRISKLEVRDASHNAVVHLHSFAELMRFSLDEEALHEVLDDLLGAD